MEIRHYLTGHGTDVFQNWLDQVRDLRARVAVLRRIDRLTSDHFGDHKFCRDGVWELRIDVGAGYRVYYALSAKTIVLQTADIRRAVNFWSDYQRRQL